MLWIPGPARLLAVLLIVLISLVVFAAGLVAQRWAAFALTAQAITAPRALPTAALPAFAVGTPWPVVTFVVIQPWVAPWDAPPPTEVPSAGGYIHLPNH